MNRIQVRVFAAIAALVLAPACGQTSPVEKGSGRVALSVVSSALSKASVVSTVFVSMTNLDSQWTTSATLSSATGDGQFSRTFPTVPAGRYGFSAEARDASGLVLFRTPSPYPPEPVVVKSGQTAFVHLLLQEVHPADPFANSAPYFLSVTASEQQVDGLRTVLLGATAADPDGDPLTFTWSSAGGGTFGRQADTTTTTATSWTPSAEGDFTIKVVAADPRGASAAFSISIRVTAATATVVAIIDLNSAPTVTSVTAAPILAGGPVTVTALASDVDGDPITFGPWTADCAGSFSTPVTGPGPSALSASSSTTFTPAAGQTSGFCTLAVTVSDGRGGSNSGSLRFSLAAVVTGEDFGPRTLTLLETSDLHSNLMPWDYFTAAPSQSVGLAKIATLVAQERAANACSLLIDDGDTIQGTPLGTYYALIDQTTRHPVATAMSALRYDAMTAGNHEFNYGLATLARFQRDATFPVLSANVRKKSDGSPAFVPYLIKTVCGVKVGILGLTTPGITTWDVENTKDLIVDLPVDAAARYLPEMRANGAEVIVVAFHAGPDRSPTVAGAPGWLTDLSTWVDNGSMPHENDVIELAQQVPGIDVILTGHTHLNIPKLQVGSTIIVQPYRWGSHLAEVKLGVDHSSGRWTVASRDSRLLPVDATVAPDPAIVALVKPYHDATVAYVEAKIGTALAPFPGGDQARFTDGALADLINAVQVDAAARAGFPVDVSLAAIFNNTGMIPQGDVKLRDAYSAYIYDNTLYVLEITGKTLRTALEQDARYFVTLDPANLPATAAATKDPNARDYNWDLYSGVDYTIDLTRAPLSRVTRLKLNGADVTDTQVLRIAVNNYRAGGGGYPAFAGSRILWKSADGVRDFLAAYVAAHPGLDPAAINTCNFTLVPNLFARYFPGVAQRCSGLPLFGEAQKPTVLAPGQSTQLRALATDGVSPSPWSFAWSDGLGAPQQGSFAVTSSPGGSQVTYQPASCLDLGLGQHLITVTATASNSATGAVSPLTFGVTVTCAPAASGPVAVKVLAINDFHGQIGAGKLVGGKAVGSAGVLASYLRTAMAGVESRTVLAEAGDLVGASPADSALLQDEPTVAFINQLANASCASMPPPAQQATDLTRFDVLFDPGCNLVGVPGNHEFDEGTDELMRLLGGGNHAKGPFLQDPWGGARFPLISSNIRKASGELLFRPYAVKYVDGVQVGFIGATLASTPSIVMPSGVAGLTFGDEVAAINAQVKELQARGIHAIVVVLHDGAYQSGGYTGSTRATQVAPADLLLLVAQLDADVDVLITGHSHNFANEWVPNAGGKGVLVTQAYSAGTAFSNIDLTVDGATQEITASTASVVTTYAAGIVPDAAAAALTAAADAMVAPIANAPVATTTGLISRSINAAGESALGDLLAEAHRVAMYSELGITNPGGMRADLPAACATTPCVITWNDCFTAQPFANQVMQVTLTGQQLKEALELQFMGWGGQTATRMLQISGFTYSWSASAPLGSRVVVSSLRKVDGTPIDLTASYTVSMNNYLQGGGDNFSVLKSGTKVIPGPIDVDALVSYLKVLPGAVNPSLDGRVSQLP
jgi:2',3'-cyclic-nucleotide 2'-phosphodiesterase/3'-nucleotidase